MTTAGIDMTAASRPQVRASDTSKLAITGDLDIRVKATLSDWTPSSGGYFATQRSAGQWAWTFSLATDGTFLFTSSADGSSSAVSVQSTASAGITDGTTKWVRVTHDVDNGASGNDVKFYTSDDGSSWSQVGSTITTAGVHSRFDSSADVAFASGLSPNDFLFLPGTALAMQVLDGIGGTPVATPDAVNDPTFSATTFRDSTNNAWTLSAGAVFLDQVFPGTVGIAV